MIGCTRFKHVEFPSESVPVQSERVPGCCRERKALVLKPRSSAPSPLPEQTSEAAATAAAAETAPSGELAKQAQEKTKSVLREYLRTKDLKESVEIFRVRP